MASLSNDAPTETTFMFKVPAHPTRRTRPKHRSAATTRENNNSVDETDNYHVITTWSMPPRVEASPEEAEALSCEITVFDGPALWTGKGSFVRSRYIEIQARRKAELLLLFFIFL